MNGKFEIVRNYIKNSWIKSVKPKDNFSLVLPYDYVPPCIDGSLTSLFYWDTYFTNKGLYLDGLTEYAFNNIENLKFCLRKFGCVPNYCLSDGAELCSQPPLLYLMVKDYYEQTKDLDFLEDSYQALELEYSFWMTKRISENGLNRYGANFDFMQGGDDHIEYFTSRLKLDVSSWERKEVAELLENIVAEAESGEDFTPRFRKQAKYINPIDLNSVLYGFELTMAEFSKILNKGQYESWLDKAQKRKALINEYCLDKASGIYFDYNLKTNSFNNVISVACYLPYVFGISENAQAIDKINAKLICANGVASCQEIESDKEKFQWGFPNCWAPHQFWAFTANQKINNISVANDIANKYLYTVSNEFENSQMLFEKYDAVKGGKAVVNEYGCPEMLGWTAGVYCYLFSQVVEKQKIT